VLIIGSGNVVHNLHRVDWNSRRGFDWARRFDDAARDQLTNSPGTSVDLRHHVDFAHAVPTPDHFIPLLYVAGLADAAGSNADVLTEGYTYGSLSMTSYTLGAGRRTPPTQVLPPPRFQIPTSCRPTTQYLRSAMRKDQLDG